MSTKTLPIRSKPKHAKTRATKSRVTRRNGTKEIAVTVTGANGQPLTIHVPNKEALKFLGRDNRLYDQYAKHLEATNKGEFVAIGLDGEIIIRPYFNEAMKVAVEKFGHQRFALRRIGYDEEMVIR